MKKAIYAMVASCVASLASADYWTQPMTEVHQSFTGDPGTIARFGDSIFISQAFFAQYRFDHVNLSPESLVALNWIRDYVPNHVWGWQSPETGASGGKTSAWPLDNDQNPPLRNIDHWLETLNPEMAVIMWGTNDLQQIGSVEAYTENMREIVQTVKANGTIPILTSIPPRHGYEEAAAAHADAVVDLAMEEGVPLIDYYHEIIDRAPGGTWDGALVYSGEGSVFDVERPVSGDGVHPSNPRPFRRNFSEEGLTKNGYNLLNYMTLHATYDVYRQVIAPPLFGDYNDNGFVDAADFTVWRDNSGATDESAINYAGDGMGGIDAADYAVWKSHFGAADSAIATANQQSPVPEPALLLTLLQAVAWIVCCRSRTRCFLMDDLPRWC